MVTKNNWSSEEIIFSSDIQNCEKNQEQKKRTEFGLCYSEGYKQVGLSMVFNSIRSEIPYKFIVELLYDSNAKQLYWSFYSWVVLYPAMI